MTVPVDIHNNEEPESCPNALFQLTALEKPSRSEVEAEHQLENKLLISFPVFTEVNARPPA